MEVIGVEDKRRWDEIIKSFPNWDIYFLCDYAISLKIHGDGEPKLFYFEKMGKHACFVSIVKDISRCDWATDRIESKQYYDMETPYGYGGFLHIGEWTINEQKEIYCELKDYCEANNIVSYFIRFSPWQHNDDFMTNLKIDDKIVVRREKHTVYIDTSSEELILANMDSKNRNMVRKAVKNGINIFHDDGKYIDDFIKIYNSTMSSNNASEYYYFDYEYFKYLKEHLKENVVFFYSKHEDMIIGASIFLFNENCMHYHLSGTLHDYRKLASTNFLIYEAAKWACNSGIPLLHLGGGLTDNDSLFGFKKQFNKNGYLDFKIGRMIFSKKRYDELLHIRKSIDKGFNESNSFLIQYRR